MENGDCKADLQRNITKTDEHEYDIELKLLVNKSDLLVVVITKAHFVYELLHNADNQGATHFSMRTKSRNKLNLM